MSAALYIAARAPRVGEVKTRLGRAIGQVAATALYRAFLRDLGARFASAPFRLGWYVTPEDAWPAIAPLVGGVRMPTRVLAQGNGNWTERQRALFRDAPARGEERVVLVASDSPQLTVEVVADAIGQLDRHDVVFGPVYDGGYYLIGMRGWHDILQGVAMSTRSVLRDLVARAEGAGLSVGWLEPTFDVDVVEDLDELREHLVGRADLPATRAMLARLGLLGPGVPMAAVPGPSRQPLRSGPAVVPARRGARPQPSLAALGEA